MAEIQEGATATNPKTGERVVFQGGQWHRLTGTDSGVARKVTPPEEAQLKDLRDDARASDMASAMAEQFVNLNRNNATGFGYKIPGVGAFMEATNPDVATMEALTARMAPAQRVPGSGTTSDRDLSLYLQAVPSIQRGGQANAQIAQQARQATTERQKRLNFYEQWANERGTLRGAEEAFQATKRQAQPAAAGRGAAPKPVKQMSNAELMALLAGGG